MLSFHNLEMKYGPAVAAQLLTEIEKATKIQSWAVAHVAPETRLANAIRIQDSVITHFAHEAARSLAA